jgi:hypothetical protein
MSIELYDAVEAHVLPLQQHLVLLEGDAVAHVIVEQVLALEAPPSSGPRG